MKVILILSTLCLFLAYSEGLKCYNCLYFSDKLPSNLSSTIKSDSSCKAGRKPDKKFIVDCSNINYNSSVQVGSNVLKVLTSVLGDTHPLLATPNQVNGTNLTITYTCAKLSYDGNFSPNYGGKKMTAMFRTCLRKFTNTNATFQQQCQNKRLSNLTIQDPDVRQVVFERALGPFMNGSQTDVNICTCTKDDCNGAFLNAQVSVFVIAASLLAAFLRKNYY